MVIVFAGRRVDAESGSEMRFPLKNVVHVGDRIKLALEGLGAKILVSSAACGADLLALEAAGTLGIRRRIVLPFSRAVFRETSVTDRPGNWGGRYDAVLDDVERRHDLVLLGFEKGNRNAYSVANHALLAEARSLAEKSGAIVQAVAAWDRKSRGTGDVTAQFLEMARGSGLPALEISTAE